MDFSNFESVFELLDTFNTEQTCIDHLTQIRWNGVVVSPYDSDSKVYKKKNNQYRCKNTGRNFNVRTGTIFEDSKIPMKKWFMALYILSSHKKGISSHQLAKDIKVTQKSAWFMLHRLRMAFDHPKFQRKLSGTVQMDETFMGGDAKNMHTNKKIKNELGNTVSQKKPVFGMREKDGIVRAKVVDGTGQADLIPLIWKGVEQGSNVHTDENPTYFILKWQFKHDAVNHSAKQYVNGMAHTNGIENFWSHLKRGMDGIYHWCSVKHLQVYIDEYTLRFNTRDYSTTKRFNVILQNMVQRLKYKDLIAK
jgi:transposase-like protein